LTPRRKIHAYVAAAAIASASLAIYSHTTVFARARTKSLPEIIFWAWERPEDLRFLNPQHSGVAFLAKTIELPARDSNPETTPARFVVRPRLQPLRIASGTSLIAVVRIETPPSNRSVSAAPSITTETRERIASEIASLQNIPSVRAIQIDFDATTSQHVFYSALLQDVRHQLRPEIPLSITALASWCIGDPWLAQLPPGAIDEAVPMLFRMGPVAANVAAFLRSGEEFPVSACRNSLGVSTDEPIFRQLLTKQFPGTPASWHKKRIYIFAPSPWTPSAANAILKEWQP
jgi:hypothetical protein